MKKQILIIATAALILAGCSKEWNCTVTTDYDYLGAPQHTETQTTFTGTTNEMHAFEDANTHNEGDVVTSANCQ